LSEMESIIGEVSDSTEKWKRDDGKKRDLLTWRREDMCFLSIGRKRYGFLWADNRTLLLFIFVIEN